LNLYYTVLISDIDIVINALCIILFPFATDDGMFKHHILLCVTDINKCKTTNWKERPKNRADCMQRSLLDYSATKKDDGKELLCVRVLPEGGYFQYPKHEGTRSLYVLTSAFS